MNKRMEAVSENRRDWQNLKSIVPFLWEYRGRAVFALSCLVLAKVATVGVPLVLKAIIDALQAQPMHEVVLPMMLVLSYGGLRLAGTLFNELRDTVFARVRYHAMRRLSVRVLAHLHELSLRFHLERQTGGISRDLDRGASSIGTLVNFMVFSLIPIAVEFGLVALVLLKSYPPLFAVVTFGTVITYVFFTFKITDWRMNHRHEMNRLNSAAGNQSVDSLINYETVRYFGNTQLEVERYNQTLSQWENVAVKSQTSMSVLNFAQGAIIALGVTVLMFLAADQVTQQVLSIGDFVMLNAFLLQLFLPLGTLGIIYRQTKYTLADMDRVFRLLETAKEVQDVPNATALCLNRGTITFENVSFAYHADRPILNNLSFTVPAGAKVAVVGRSGAGKSTLSRLLYRFYDIGAGRILIDDQDIAQVTQASLQRAIAIVPQDTVLFNETIRYNLQYANMAATQAELEHAADVAYIRSFIESLPEGWNTVVGERGLKLSGGEKQRVAIARAILKQAPIFIFDEATSSLDSATEQAIQKTLREVAGQHTTLMIAHRLSTIVDADQILVMDKGRIVERGTHVQLLSQHGLYQTMWELQLNGEN